MGICSFRELRFDADPILVAASPTRRPRTFSHRKRCAGYFDRTWTAICLVRDRNRRFDLHCHGLFQRLLDRRLRSRFVHGNTNHHGSNKLVLVQSTPLEILEIEYSRRRTFDPAQRHDPTSLRLRRSDLLGNAAADRRWNGDPRCIDRFHDRSD